ncbi:MAG: SurA N-terminal domain-containing protein [Candidatus Paceibacterota bacterium]
MENLDKRKNIASIVVLILAILIIGGYFVFGKNKTNNIAPSVAIVNGAPILKTAYDTALTNSLALYKTEGIDTEDATKLSQIKTQVLDNLINNELLLQGVSNAGIKTTSEEIEKQFQLILTQSGGKDKFQAELIKNNLTETQLRENISKQITIQTYLLQNIDTKSINVSEAEIEQLYADYSKIQKDSGQKDVPALKDLSEEIKQQIISNKQQVLVGNFISSLRAKAKIEKTI